MINLYGISNIFVAITSLYIAIFVFVKGYRHKITRIWSVFSVCVAIYGFGAYMASGAKSYDLAFRWWQFSYVGVILLPLLFLIFVFEFLSIKQKPLVRIITLFTSICLLADIFTKKLFVGNVSLLFTDSKFFTPAWWIYPPGPLHIFYVIFFYLGLLIYGHVKLIKAYDTSSPLKKQQIKYFFLATALGFIGGGTSFLPCFGIKIYPIYNLTVPLYPLIMTYAIIKHQLMDIDVVIKKTLIFASLFTIVFGTFVGITLLTQQFIASRLLGLAISSIIIIFTVRPLENFLIKVTDKYLFQKKYDPLQLLKTFSDMVLASVLDQTAIIKIAVDLLMKALSLESFAVLLMNKEGDKYEIVGSSGIEDKNVSFSSSSYLIIYLNKTFSPISKINHDKAVSNDLAQDMNAIKAELCIPLVFHKNLVGFLAFGKRKSGNDYTSEDINILVPLTRDIAIAIVYARLYEEIRQKDKLATLGTLVAGIKHEIGNPLSTMLTSTQLFMRDMEEWNNSGMSQKGREDKVKDILNEVISEALRIGRITRKFTDFARPGDEGVKEILDIEKSMNEALEILENELSLKHIKIEKDIPQDVPQILADKDQVHQIFFNLLRNAAQAIEASNKPQEESKISIVVRRKVNDRVTIDISDTGCGIPEEKKIKIFEPFFTTKERGKGTGLGLAIVQQLVGKNKGDISFKSQKGEGATFTLEFPIAKNG